MQTTIGSWNLRNLSSKRDLGAIAEIIKKFNIIAIQEVRDPDAIKTIALLIGYSYIVSDPICSTLTSAHQTGKRKERYAFLWDASVKVIGIPELVHGDTKFVRSPFIGFFKSGNFDFILSTIHIVWGKKSDRVIEIVNVNNLLQKITESANGEGDIILCGDFNTPPENFQLPREWSAKIKNGTVVGSGSRYDNIWINEKNTTEFVNAGVMSNFNNSSDHWPIFGIFNISIDDDNGTPDLNINLDS